MCMETWFETKHSQILMFKHLGFQKLWKFKRAKEKKRLSGREPRNYIDVFRSLINLISVQFVEAYNDVPLQEHWLHDGGIGKPLDIQEPNKTIDTYQRK